MKVRFKIIHFVPDPFSGARVPVGVVARRGSEDAQVIIAPRVPRSSAHQVVDTEDAAERDDFLARVRQVGQSAEHTLV